jgi:hypothetical protein
VKDEVKLGRGFIRWSTRKTKDGKDRVVRLWSFTGWKEVEKR